MNLKLIIKPFFFVGYLLLLVSCSSSKLKIDKDVPLKDRLNTIDGEIDFNEENQKQTFFIDKTKAYGLGDVKAYNLNIVDINGDDYSDIVVIPSFYSQPEFYYYNIHKKVFEKGRSPFSRGVKASFIQFYDINHDNILDAVTGVLNQKTELSKEPLRIFYGKKKDGKLFFEKALHSLVASPNSTIGLIDYNLDGNLDLFVGNWFTRYKGNPIPFRDYLYENRDGKKFVDISDKLYGETKQNLDKTMYTNATPTYASQICDIDQNGYPDILTTSTNKYKNRMWMNQFKGRTKKRFFKDHGHLSLFGGDTEGNLNKQGGGRSFGVACADYNNDGIMDAFLGELSHNYDHEGIDKSSILTGSTFKFPPKFYRTEYTVDAFDPNWHQGDRRGVWFDYNNDGLLDLLVDNSGYPPHTKLILFHQHEDHSFENYSERLGLNIVNPIASVIADFNRDGKMDILTSQSNIRDAKIQPRLYLLENALDLSANKSIRFYLRGSNSNYHGINATIILKVRYQGKIETRRQTVSYSYGALPPQNEEGIHFGLKEGDELLSVIVRWPYSIQKNQHRVRLEKVYKINTNVEGFLSITLCEEGHYLVGRRSCD